MTVRKASKRAAPLPRAWTRVSDERLLDARFRDLPLKIEGSWLGEALGTLHCELEARGIRLKPHAWLSTEWFSPDGIPGIAIPFYLAHPRLMKLEKAQMLGIEGGTRAACLRILRHEAGHALCSAYRLHHRKAWRDAFGLYTAKYPRYYRPRPDSRDHVVHLDGWYAQAHPAEDFAETFAVWLAPRSRWRARYAEWDAALAKLECVERLIAEHVVGRAPAVRSTARVEDISRMTTTLRDHYAHKREMYAVSAPRDLDLQLLKIFSADPHDAGNLPASTFLRQERKELCTVVAAWTGGHAYTVDQLLKTMIERCQRLRLRLTGSRQTSRMQAKLMLTVHVMDHLRARRFEIAL